MNSSILDRIRKAKQTESKAFYPPDLDVNSHTINFKQSYDREHEDGYDAKKVMKSNMRSNIDIDERTVDTTAESGLPALTDKTKMMLEKIKKKRSSTIANSTNKDIPLELSQPTDFNATLDGSKAFLYRDFDVEKKIKVLPNCLIDLFYFMKEYDAAINLLYIKKRTPFYKDIRDIVRHALCKENTLQDFCKVLSITPSLYKIRWVLDERTKSYDLLIEMNYNSEDSVGNFRYFSSQKIKERQKLFYFGLIEFLTDRIDMKQLMPEFKDTNKGEFSIFENIDMVFEHSLGLSNTSSSSTAGDKLMEKLKEFKETVLEIPIYELPSNPGRELRSGREQLDFKKPSLIAKKPKIIDELRAKGLVSAKPSSSCKSKENESIAIRKQKIEDLKSKLLQKVKDNANRLETAIKPEQSEFTDVSKDLKQMVDHLHLYYTKRNVESMYYPNVLRYMEKNYYKEYNLDELDKLIRLLIEKVPDWITLLVINGQDILRVKQGFNIKLLLKEII